MGNEWQDYKVEDIGKVVGGGTPSTKNDSYWNGEIPWVSPKDLTGVTNRYLKKGDRNITKLGLEK